MTITGKYCSFCRTPAIASIIQDAHPTRVWRICREHLMQIVPKEEKRVASVDRVSFTHTL